MISLDTTNLRPYQVSHVARLAEALHKPGFPCAWDMSDTGTGKTYAACALVRQYKVPTAVVCPKSLMPSWERVARFMGVPEGLLVPLNYEIIRTGRSHFGDWRNLPTGTSGLEYFHWNKSIQMLIFDEMQRCRGHETLNHRIAIGAKLSGVPVIGASATFGESPLDFRAVGYLSDWFEWRAFFSWLRGMNCYKPPFENKWFFVDTKHRSTLQTMAELRRAMMYRGSRIAIDDLGDQFPKNVIAPELYRISGEAKIRSLYKQIEETFSQLQARKELDKDPDHGLTATLRERQEVELLKAPLLAEMAESEISQGRSAVIFCNFLFTIQDLSRRLKHYDPAIITGQGGWGYDILRRSASTDSEVERFQHNDTFLAVAQSDIGGVGLGFHDLYGRPRTSIINPHWSAMVFKQILGRIHRDGALSPALQKFPFIEGTIEERIFEAFVRKAGHLHTLLTDAELQPYAGMRPELVTI